RGLAAVREAYDRAGIDASTSAFIDDMAQAYGWADLAICRAGALTIAELQAAGLGAILVPYPAAVDDHQTRNAAVLTRAGAARLAPERDLTADGLAASIGALTGERAGLLAMAEAARATAVTDAAAQLADICLAAGAPR
ncbi:MAG: UDP-N-acetylglucosamine--N-acetylmuramyl-(pentapeptide) pyrophosphoryl-undecaprenol N-acetylglucosamine transferase, partial [Gammaproteobacteria bacterium]|nr:UDP-N-acetylglucosamine--N-acetylmuramyl-(pentapeptide) pyrophosphoryl-undecaprenol N-acetylglucosamine transferase [Gammaproteobacteria bacterium]